MPSQRMMRGDKMVVFPVCERPNQRVLMRSRGEAGQMLADVHARYLRGNRLELAAHLGRRIGLHVKRIDMAGSAGEKDQDNGLRFSACWQLRGCRRLSSRAQSGRQTDAKQSGIT